MNFVDFNKKNKIFLAPMAGVTDLAFRTICRKCGASLCYTEMVSAKAMHYEDKKTIELLKTNETDNPLIVQIFGSEPDIMAEASEKIYKMGFSAIDINCGCPTPKITSNGDGSFLMNNPKLIGKIVKSAVDKVPIPISIKIRAGYSNEVKNAVECAKEAEANGASFIAVHGRTREQFYSGTADYSIIKDVKQAVQIPVIGNGDVFSPESAKKLLDETECDGILIGRGSLGRPYIFQQIKDFLNSGTYCRDYSPEYKLSLLKEQVRLSSLYKDERRTCLEARKHIAWYLKGTRDSKIYREASNSVKTLNEIYTLCDKILENINRKGTF